MNKVILLGNIGKVDLHAEEGKTPLLKFSLATNKRYKNKDGENVDVVSWHRCQVWGNRATSLAPHVEKGQKVLVEGELSYGSYEKDGVTHYTTDIKVDKFSFEGGKRGESTDSADTSDAPAPTAASNEIPF